MTHRCRKLEPGEATRAGDIPFSKGTHIGDTINPDHFGRLERGGEQRPTADYYRIITDEEPNA